MPEALAEAVLETASESLSGIDLKFMDSLKEGGDSDKGFLDSLKENVDSFKQNESLEESRFKGGYFGELKQHIRDTGQDGTRAVHHMPSTTALFNANVLDHGSSPAIIMDEADHALTASYGNTSDSEVYQTKQMELLNEGKFDEALQMDIDNLKNLGFYEKYEGAIAQMFEYVDVLKKEGRL